MINKDRTINLHSSLILNCTIVNIIKMMARSVLQIKGYTAEEIRQLFKKDERYTIGVRLYDIHQVALANTTSL